MSQTFSNLSPRSIRTLARTTGVPRIRRDVTATAPTSTVAGPELQPRDTSGLSADPVVDPLPDPSLGLPVEYTTITPLRVIRGGDLFNGIFTFHNLHRSSFNGHAVRVDPDLPSYLALELPGQNFGEEALEEEDVNQDQNGGFTTPLRARLAGPSRVVVQMPYNESSLPITLNALLAAMNQWSLSVDPLAHPIGDGLRTSMLRAVRETFGGLLWMLQGETASQGLSGLGVLVSTQATNFADEKFELIKGVDWRDARDLAEAVREDVEEQSEIFAQAARNATSGDQKAKREAGELIESLYEVYFAWRLAGRILESGTGFGLNLLFMSGLFNLMMHPHNPANTATALEIPYRLITSPGSFARFRQPATSPAPDFSAGERVEMWRTRLGHSSGVFTDGGLDFFGLWTPDYTAKDEDEDPFRMSLTPPWRRDIVKRTTGHNEEPVGGGPQDNYEPVPAKVRRLELSPLGATLDLGITWQDDSQTYPGFGGLIGWDHYAALGRDQRVRIAEAGVLYPFGIPCTKVTLTERRFLSNASGRWAPLRQKVFLIVDANPLVFPLDGQLHSGRGLPFKTLRCTTGRTPSLDSNAAGLPMNGQKVEVNNQAFLFEFLATDDQGREIAFDLAQYYLPAAYWETWSTHRASLESIWEGDAGLNTPTAPYSGRYRARLSGQMMRMARGASVDLDMSVEEIAFGPAHGTGANTFSPAMKRAKAWAPGVAEISGVDDMPRDLVLTNQYLEGTLPSNGARVMLKIENPIDLSFEGGIDSLDSDAMGAIGHASQTIGAIADGLGPIPLPDPNDLNKMIQGNADWDDLLPKFKILGNFLLEKLVASLSDYGGDLPTFRTRRSSEELIREWKLQKSITRTFDEAGIVLAPRNTDAEILLHTFVKATLKKLDVTGEFGGDASTLTIPTDLENPTAEAHGHITNIDLTLFELMQVRFDEIGFDAIAGKKPDARVVMNDEPIVFYGALEFLNGLKNLIPSDGLGHGPMINPVPSGIQAKFDIGLPNVEVGVFALKNMTLGATTTIPFQEKPIDLAFNFNERHRPFEIAVAGLGGGGFFALAVDAGGVREIEAALEFGAQLSMNIGVASGSVSVKGGVYFRYRNKDVLLEGYVELRGRLSVLALITVSLVFNLALAYEKRHSEQRALVRGQATLRVEVEVLFFSTSVTLHVERSFNAGEADPAFSAMTSQRDWAAICAAYA
ncbi:MAG: hypothetical protein AAGC81_13365 [Pseudomonadota bacterium]